MSKHSAEELAEKLNLEIPMGLTEDEALDFIRKEFAEYYHHKFERIKNKATEESEPYTHIWSDEQ